MYIAYCLSDLLASQKSSDKRTGVAGVLAVSTRVAVLIFPLVFVSQILIMNVLSYEYAFLAPYEATKVGAHPCSPLQLQESLL